jgi:hypothetical protein
MDTPNLPLLQPSVANVLKKANTFINSLEAAVLAEEKQVQTKRKELATLEQKVTDLDESIDHGRTVAKRFKDLLKK